MEPIEGEFICRKCQTPLNIFTIKVSPKGFVFFNVMCPKKHSGQRKFNMAQQNEWMPIVIKHLYMCPRCSSNLTDVKQKTEGDKTVLLLNCPTHGKVKKIISTSFWYAMDALRKQLSARPAYPSAYPPNYPAQYPPTYPAPGYQQPPPANPYSAPPSGGYSPPPAGPPQRPPETISPPQFEVAPPTPPKSSSSPARENQVSLGDEY